MFPNLDNYVSSLMIHIPKGKTRLRDFKDEQKWISSNYQFAIPGRRKNLKEVIWDVEIEPFFLAKYPVTEEFYSMIRREHLDKWNYTQKPAVNVSWINAVIFCNLLSEELNFEKFYEINKENNEITCNFGSNGFRLPTDAEWQYACKADSKGYRYGEIDKIAWYKDNSNEQVHEVGEKMPNNWGLYDMIGNVWEWCWDLYDPETFGDYRIIRGGSWAEEERGCGATCRRKSMPNFSIDDIGFRIARSIV